MRQEKESVSQYINKPIFDVNIERENSCHHGKNIDEIENEINETVK